MVKVPVDATDCLRLGMERMLAQLLFLMDVVCLKRRHQDKEISNPTSFCASSVGVNIVLLVFF